MFIQVINHTFTKSNIKIMITQELKELVLQEALNIKKHATKCELDKLDFQFLDPKSTSECIYGQMTGDCFSDRAVYLLNLCAIPYAKLVSRHYGENSDCSYSIYNSESRDFSPIEVYTPIEVYLLQKKSQNETLVKFLKSEIDNLTLEML